MKTDPFLLYLVRHGEAEGQSSRSDSPLSAYGTVQMERASKLIRMHSYNIVGIASSPLARAVMSARILASEFNAPLTIEQSLEPEGDTTGFLTDFLSGNEGDRILVGHLPSLRRIASDICGCDAPVNLNIHCGGVVCLSVRREHETFKGVLQWSSDGEL
jgi:phosphohistidine phosphatase SixA